VRIPTTDLPSIIGDDLNIARKYVNATIKLFDDGATIPFIARYRKEATGGLDEVKIHSIKMRLDSLREFLKRREFVVNAIREAGALTDELAERIERTLDPAVLEDIYVPFKPRRRTKAEAARERGLEPLARIVMAQNIDKPHTVAKKFVKPAELNDADEALAGACDIIAEWVSESEKARTLVRQRYLRSATITSTRNPKGEDPNGEYANYYEFSSPLRLCVSHRYLAIRRGEEAGVLKVSINIDDNEMVDRLCRMFVKSDAEFAVADLVRTAVRDGYRRLLRPSIETEVANSMKEKADAAAIDLFSDNLRQLLLAPPMFGKRVMGIDPGFESGCKIACLDENGNLLAVDAIFPNPPHCDYHGATYTVCSMVDAFGIDVIAIGSGTGGRETEKFLASLRYPRYVQLAMVSEDGASVYSASEIAREEFPDLDVTMRGAVSIGRRLLDPLAELVKIEPKSIGVGQYQHDVDQNRLREALEYTIESCVNSVGVNVNTASSALLQYVSGIGPSLARYIVEYRQANGPFKERGELMNVSRMGVKAYEQCAGFLRISGGTNPLDNTGIHPEVYPVVEQMARDVRTTTASLIGNQAAVGRIVIANYLTKTVGEPTLRYIISELLKPTRDPRDEADPFSYDATINSINDLRPGMEVTGKVNNITAFGAFVDLGIKENGLLHISQMSDRFISSPFEVVRMDQEIRARVLDVDYERGRIALTLKQG
jgi:uncharacterized protein